MNLWSNSSSNKSNVRRTKISAFQLFKIKKKEERHERTCAYALAVHCRNMCRHNSFFPKRDIVRNSIMFFCYVGLALTRLYRLATK